MGNCSDIIPPFDFGCNQGIAVRKSELLFRNEFKQFRFPKSKKKRIRKKWSKRDCNLRITPVYFAVKAGNTIFVHPKIYQKIVLHYDQPTKNNS